jgi:Lipocalin-like domain
MIRAFLISAASAAVLMLSPIPASTAAESIRDKAVGTWRLLSVESLRSNGQSLNIWMGPHPIGLIIYQPNGYMAVQIMHDPRPTFAESRVTGTGDELRNAYFGNYAYWGTYTVDEAESTIEHKIQSSLWPEEVGGTRKRTLRFEGTKLVLTTPSYKAGLMFPHDLLESAQVRGDEDLINRLTWERID